MSLDLSAVLSFDYLCRSPVLDFSDGQVIFKKVREVTVFPWYHDLNLDWGLVWRELVKSNFLLLMEVPLTVNSYRVINSCSCFNELDVAFRMDGFCIRRQALLSIEALVNREPRPWIVGIDDGLDGLLDRHVSLFANAVNKLGLVDAVYDDSYSVGCVVGNLHATVFKELFDAFTNVKSCLRESRFYDFNNAHRIPFFLREATTIKEKFKYDFKVLIDYYSSLIN